MLLWRVSCIMLCFDQSVSSNLLRLCMSRHVFWDEETLNLVNKDLWALPTMSSTQ